HDQRVGGRHAATPCLIVPTELAGVVQLADRIMVMYQGRSVGIVDPGTSRETLGQMMAGVAA
ncbi:MAG: heme ABC transporter ATP-binding protein, partial [Pseudoclavibacter sp.]|nr:heme ABC transporter ATP-binding protein [Pseudoclavibacter sp.]